jgi:hypothetical protein
MLNAKVNNFPNLTLDEKRKVNKQLYAKILCMLRALAISDLDFSLHVQI